MPGGAHGLRQIGVGEVLDDHPRGEIEHLRGAPVVGAHPEPADGGRADQLGQRPRRLARVRPRALRRITDDRPTGARPAAAEHPPLHRGDVLGLVDQHVREGVLRRRERIDLADGRQPLHRGHQLLDLAAAVQVVQEERHLAILRLGHRTELVGQFVEKGSVGDGPVRGLRALAVARAEQALLALGEFGTGDPGQQARFGQPGEGVRRADRRPPRVAEHREGGGVADPVVEVVPIQLKYFPAPAARGPRAAPSRPPRGPG